MTIYSSSNLTITHQDEMFIKEWINPSLSIEDFKNELKIVMSFYEKIRPKSVLWLQENFKLQIPPSLYEWFENDILKRQYETGMTNMGFTVSPDMLSHLSIMASFEKVQSLIQPHFFTDREVATDFLKKEMARKSELTYSVERLDDKARVSIELDFNLLPKVITKLKKIEAEYEFINDNLDKIKSLTRREMEIFRLIVNGYTSKEISSQLFVETSTISTHRKRIISKLDIDRSVDWFLLAKAFDLFD